MISSLGFSLLACLPLFGPVSGAGVQEPDVETNALERWQRMSTERREVMRRRFEELRSLSPEERAVLEERHRGVRSMRERLRRGLSSEVRRQLEQLAPEQRHTLMREELVEEARGRGARIRGKLPPEFERELEAAEPEQRAQLLEDFRHAQFERRAERHLNHLAEQLGLSDAERDRIAALPPREHRRELSRLEKQRVVTEADARGAPPIGIEPTAWKRLRQLPPEGFLDEMLKRGALEGPPGASRGAGQDGQRGEGSTGDPVRRRLRELLRPDVAERIEFVGLPRAERKRRVSERVSGRALDYLEREGLVEPAELARLRGLSGPERVRALRELARGRSTMKGRDGRGRGERAPGMRHPGGPGGPPQRGGPGGPGRREGPGDRVRGPRAGAPPPSAGGGRQSKGEDRVEGRGENRDEGRGDNADGRGGQHRRDASGRGGREPR